jgi:hypothetical protein
LTSLDASLALSSILGNSEGTGAAAAFPFPLLLVTVVDSTAKVVLGGVLNSPPPRFWGVGVDGANGSKSSPPESPAVDELLFETPIQLTAHSDEKAAVTLSPCRADTHFVRGIAF